MFEDSETLQNFFTFSVLNFRRSLSVILCLQTQQLFEIYSVSFRCFSIYSAFFMPVNFNETVQACFLSFIAASEKISYHTGVSSIATMFGCE